MNTIETTSAKSKQFIEELNSLLGKYQYTLVPQLKTTPAGIIPVLTICDVLPPKEPVVPIQPIPAPVKKVRMFKK